MQNITTCSVTMNGKTTTSADFVAILSKENGDTGMMYNTDVLTLGMAMKMITRAFVECLHECNEEERNTLKEILGTDLVNSAITKEETNE